MNPAESSHNKQLAWSLLGGQYWNRGYYGGPSEPDIAKFLAGISREQTVMIAGASTIQLIQQAKKIASQVGVLDFAQVMIDDLRAETVHDAQACYLMDLTSEGNLHIGAFDYLLADRLINRFAACHLEQVMKNIRCLLSTSGEARLSVRIGLYQRDLKIIERLQAQRESKAFFNPVTWEVNYYDVCPIILQEVLPEYGEIERDKIVNHFMLRGLEKRFRPGEFEDMVERSKYLKLKDKLPLGSTSEEDHLFILAAK